MKTGPLLLKTENNRKDINKTHVVYRMSDLVMCRDQRVSQFLELHIKRFRQRILLKFRIYANFSRDSFKTHFLKNLEKLVKLLKMNGKTGSKELLKYRCTVARYMGGLQSHPRYGWRQHFST